MTQTNSQESTTPGKGKAFFSRAEQVAATGNWDFAIELYLEGIAREPENIERGHQKLREVSLKRKAQGGKGPGMMDKLKRRPVKDDPVSVLTCAEYFLAKEPGSEMFMAQVLKAAQTLNLPNVIKWICDTLLESQRQAAKPNRRVLTVLTDAYAQQELYGLALQACELARKAAPTDEALRDRYNQLSADYTIHKGKYDQEGDFTRSVKDLDEQKRLSAKDALSKDQSYTDREVEEKKAGYLANPTISGKIVSYVDALTSTEDEAREAEAVEVLQQAFQQSQSYQYKMRIGEIKIRQISRHRRKALEAGDEKAAAELARKQLEFELEEYAERVANYPTDLAMKYELGRRQLAAGQVDDAITSFQQAQRDLRRRSQAMNYLGMAFARKGWHREAADTYAKALEDPDVPEERVKEIRYNLGDALEKMGEPAKARDEFSMVAQIDYNYKDVRQRLEAIRKNLGGTA